MSFRLYADGGLARYTSFTKDGGLTVTTFDPATAQTRLVAAIVPSVGHSLFSDMLDALIHTLAAMGFYRQGFISAGPPLRRAR